MQFCDLEDSDFDMPERIEFPKSPYISPAMGARCLRLGVDESYDNEVYLWCRILEFGSDSEWEFDIGDGETPKPEWWEQCVSEDIRYIIHGTEDHDLLNWALHHGLCPNQEFVLRVSEPHWYRCSFEYEEYDYDVDVEVVRIEPPETSSREFERMIVDYFEMLRVDHHQIEAQINPGGGSV